ncbi:MAG: elongation factor G [Planctomycetaceae bacterium]
MARFAVENLRNVALVGHGGVGKTTLADLMLFKAGKNSRVGSVDHGTSLLDSEDEERVRHHSIHSALCHFDHQGAHINLIDAPGMPDFVGQGIGALRACETAIVAIDALHGILVNSRRMFRRAGADGVARMIVITKCDLENIRFDELIESIQETFGHNCVLMNVPVGLGSQLKGVVSTIDVPADVSQAVVDPKDAGQKVIDAAIEADEVLMERYLEGGTLSQQELQQAITKAIAARTLIPIYCVSTTKDIGIRELMDGIAQFAPPPACVLHQAMRGEERFDIVPKADGPVIAQVFKTRIDPFVAKMSYIRIYSGTLHKDATLKDVRTGKMVKVANLLDVQGAHTEAVGDVGPGEIIAVVKSDELQTGDTLVSGIDGLQLPEIAFPKPMIGLAVEPKTQADQARISMALHKIEEEDPCFYVDREEQTHEMVMHGMSELHLQLIQKLLHDRDKVDIVTHLPRIPYRETVMGAAEGSYRHKKQSGGSGQFAEVHMRVSACPQGIDPNEFFTKDRFASLRTFHYDPELNFAFVDRVSGGSIPNQYIPAVEKGVRERLVKGVLAGNQIQDIVVEVFFGKDHPVDSNETAFRIAASHCLKNIFLDAKPTLLEPLVHLEITVPSDKIGEITSDLNTRRGRMEGMDEAPGGFTTIKAHAPLSEVMTYARSLSSLTGGQGSFTLEFSHYEMVPPNEQAKIIAEAKQEVEET